MPDIFFDNEFRKLIFPLTPDERQGLESSLCEHGNLAPIVVWKERQIVMDGHNRYDICQLHNIPLLPPKELSFPDRDAAMLWMIDNQLGRRNVPAYNRIGLVKLREDIRTRRLEAEANLHNSPGRPPKTFVNVDKPLSSFTPPINIRKEVAAAARVSTGTVAKYDIVEAKATPEQKAKLAAGEATVNQVYVQIHQKEVKDRVSQKLDWPIGKYRVIYADPPWQYNNHMPLGRVGTQDDHYPTLPVSEICLLPVKDLALDNSVLFLWATSPILQEAFKVVDAWGFSYKSSFVWDKIKHNMGHYNSIRHEILLVAVKGSCPPDIAKLYDSVQSVERGEHSEKPALFREIIQSLYPYGPRVELFARGKTEGWVCYGNEI